MRGCVSVSCSYTIIFIRGCDVCLKVTLELLEKLPMYDTTTGIDIFNELKEVLTEYK